jgi:hypothetical protein
MSFKEIKELRQAGKLDEALQMAHQTLNADPDNIWNKRAAAWVYYEYLKRFSKPNYYDAFKDNLVKLMELQLPDDEKMVFDNCAWQIGSLVFALQKIEHVDFAKINELFAIIKAFHFSKPTEAYSFLYKAFHKGYKNWQNYLEFADWWNFENFRTEDFLKEEYEGRKIMSIAEQAYIAYASKLLDDFSNPNVPLGRDEHILKINRFIPQLAKIIDSHPEFQYPQYFKAKLLLAIGDQKNVLSALLPFAKTKRNDFWVWDVLADAFQDNERKIACLCKALSVNAPDDFTIKTRQKFAKLLVNEKLFDEAKTEIEKIIAIRNSNSWKVPNEIANWANQAWFKSANALPNMDYFYRKHINTAEEILFSDVPEIIVAVEFVNADKQMASFVRDESIHGFFKYSRLINKVKVGDILKVRFIGEGKDNFFKALTIKKLKEEIDIPAIKTFRGNIKINTTGGFGFVEDVFLESNLINHYKTIDNQMVTGKAILSFNKKKGKWGWKAFLLSNLE